MSERNHAPWCTFDHEGACPHENTVQAMREGRLPMPPSRPSQRFSRWFTDWPSTHVNAGETVEVMPVSEHEAEMARRSRVDHQTAEAHHREYELALAALRDAAQAVVDESAEHPWLFAREARVVGVLRAVLASAGSEPEPAASDEIQTFKRCIEQARAAYDDQPNLNLIAAWRDALAAHSDAELAEALACDEALAHLVRETRRAQDAPPAGTTP